MINLIEPLDDFLVQKNIATQGKRKPRELGRFWPSESSVWYTNPLGEKCVIGKCAREIWYSMNCVPPTNPPDAIGIRRMKAGVNFENEERILGEEMGIIVPDEKYPLEFKQSPEDPPRRFKKDIGDGITISGEIDILYLIDNSYYIGEIKSGYGYMFNRDIFVNNQPKKEHLMQLGIYLDVFKKFIKHGLLLYVDRGECTRRQFTVELQPDGSLMVDGSIHPSITIPGIYDRIRYVNSFIKAGQPPVGDYSGAWSPDTIEKRFSIGLVPKTTYKEYKTGKKRCIGDYQCHYCSYLKKCIIDQGQKRI